MSRNKTAIITGASSGLGLETTKALVSQGFRVVMVSRGEAKLLEAANQIRQIHPDAEISEHVVDISNLDQVRNFAKSIDGDVDLLMNNAGVMGPDFSLSIEGIESQMATNHVGHFLLTKLLWQNLEQAAGPRVISLSSVVHRRGNLKSLDLEILKGANRNSYDRWQRYADTKLACLFFARELDIRAKQAGSKVLSIAAHPGWAITGLQDNFPNRFDAFAQSATEGAQSQLAAAHWDLTGGEFVGPSRELWGKPKLIKGSSHSRDLEVAKRLWLLTEELIGESFTL